MTEDCQGKGIMAYSTAPVLLLAVARGLHILKSLSEVWETLTSVLRNYMRPAAIICLNTSS